MSQAEWFLLSGVAEVHHVANIVHQFGEIGFALLLQKTFQLRRRIEVVLNGILAAAGNHNNVVDTRSHAFFDHVLYEWLVYYGQHFLGLRFSSGQETSAQSRGWKDGFANA